jgi:hypothetical protein
MIENSFFFIDDQGSLSSKDKWVLLGGLLMSIGSYNEISKEIKALNKQFFGNNVKEVKWSDLQACIYQKNKGKKFKSNKASYLNMYSIEFLEKYIENFFRVLNKYNYQVIISIAHKDLVSNLISKDNFLKCQVEDLMQRVQYHNQTNGGLSTFIHDSRSSQHDNNNIKDTFEKLLRTSRFGVEYERIINNLFIEDSHRNEGIQIADFIIGVTSATLRGYPFSSSIYRRFIGKHIRRSNLGEIIGYGIMPTRATKNNKYRNFLRKELDVQLVVDIRS